MRVRPLAALLLWLGLLAGCAAAPTDTPDGAVMDMDADSAIVHGAAAEARADAAGHPYEYRAVCFELSQHAGSVHVMSKWTEDPDVPRRLGDYHGNFKEKGHHWVLERRVKK